jgi:hypothetical protein
MSTAPLFPSFDGLLDLSRHEGVDIRPTLLRVLIDLYVQTPRHSGDEKRQFTELVLRLVDAVDDATRTAVRARLMLCPDTPAAVAARLGLPAPAADNPLAESESPAATAPAAVMAAQIVSPRGRLTMRPDDAAEIAQLFAAAGASERILILQSLDESPLVPAARPGPQRAARAIETLEMAAIASDLDSFAFELSNVLLLPAAAARAIVEDTGGEPIACACKAVGMEGPIFQRVLLFLKPELGASVIEVFRLARLYSGLRDRAALIMIEVWRGATLAKVRARYRPVLYDDERRSARSAGVASSRGEAARPAAAAPRSETG